MQNAQTAQNYADGINGYTGNPMQAAADADDRYLASIQDAVQSGRRRQALLAVPVTTWKGNATGKGKQRLAEGARVAAPKVQAHFQKWTPIYQSIANQVASMPKGGKANSMARVAAAYDALKQAAGKTIN